MISESAVSQARNHLNEYPFKGIFKIVRDRYLRFEEIYLPFGQPLIYCGVDGSYLNLPDFQSLLAFFGARDRNKDSPTGQMCLIFGSFSHFIYDAVLEPLRFTERSLALERLQALSQITDLQRFCFIFDRGYPSLKFFDSLENLKTNFIVRSKDKWYGLNELQPQQAYRLYVGNYAHALRAVILKLPNDKRETLITNLLDEKPETFKDLYYLRWPVEIAFYFLKHVLRLEDFNGYTKNSIFQNFWIAVSLSNIAAIFVAAANLIVQAERKDAHNKYDYQVNVSETITILHTRIIELLLNGDEKKRRRCVEDVIRELKYYVTPVRPELIRLREQTRKVFYHHNQKVH